MVSQKKPEKKAPLNRKERRELKRKKRKNFDLISKGIHLWEKLRKYVPSTGGEGRKEGGGRREGLLLTVQLAPLVQSKTTPTSSLGSAHFLL